MRQVRCMQTRHSTGHPNQGTAFPDNLPDTPRRIASCIQLTPVAGTAWSSDEKYGRHSQNIHALLYKSEDEHRKAVRSVTITYGTSAYSQ